MCIPHGLRWLRIRWLISKLTSPDPAISIDACARLSKVESEHLARHADVLYQGLAHHAYLAEPIKFVGSLRDQCSIPPIDAYYVLLVLAKHDPTLLLGAREFPELQPYAFRALLRVGRPELACPEPSELTLFGSSAPPAHGAASLEWGSRSDRAPDRDFYYDDRDGMLRMEDDNAIVRCGLVAPREVTIPPVTGAEWLSEAPVVIGETYVLWTMDRDVDLMCELTILEHVPGDRVRFRWQVLEIRAIE